MRRVVCNAHSMAETQAIFYRDKCGGEPVNEFIEALPAKRAAKIGDYVEEHLNGRAPDAPPPEFPADFRRRMDMQPRKPPRAAGKDAPPTKR